MLITHDVDEAIQMSDRIYLLTGTPGEIRHEIRIEEPKDAREKFSLSPEFLGYKQRIMEILQA